MAGYAPDPTPPGTAPNPLGHPLPAPTDVQPPRAHAPAKKHKKSVGKPLSKRGRR